MSYWIATEQAMGDWVKAVLGGDGAAATPELAPLRALVEQVEAATSVADAVQLVRAWMVDPAATDATATAQRDAPDAVAALLSRLAARRGLATHASQIRRLIAGLARERARAQRGATAGGPGLAEALAWESIPASLSCPPGWSLTADGVHRVQHDGQTGAERLVPVCGRPILVVGRCLNDEEQAAWLAIAWPTRRGWTVDLMLRDAAMNARAIIALARNQAPVTSGNAQQVVEFLSEFETFNDAILPDAFITSRMGWHLVGDQRCFLWGRHVITAAAVTRGDSRALNDPAKWQENRLLLHVEEPGQRELVNAFVSAGTWEGWLDMVRGVQPYPSVFVGLYAAMVPPLMHLLPNLPNFVFEWCGTTSRGKTVSLRLAASAWGYPDERNGGIPRTWNASQVYVERAPALADFLPTFLDDTKRCRLDDPIAKIVYEFTGGVGRLRGSLKGLQSTARFHGVLISTGEVPITSFTNDGGTHARAICLWGSPFGGHGDPQLDAVRALEAGVQEHYGHAGPRLIRWLLTTPEAAELVRQEHARALRAWDVRARRDGVLSRMGTYFAGLTVARRVLHEALGVPAPHRDALEFAWSQAQNAMKDADRPAEALRDVLSWATSQQHRFWGRGEPAWGYSGAPTGGWLGAWSTSSSWRQLAVLPTELRGFLDKQRHDTEAVLKAWQERGWMLVEDGHRTRKVVVGERKERCIVISREACDVVQGGDEAG